MSDDEKMENFNFPAEAARFYYLNLMSKKPPASEPISISKPKFVQWGAARRFSTSLEEDPELEVGKGWS